MTSARPTAAAGRWATRSKIDAACLASATLAGVAAGEDDVAVRHPLGERLGRIGEQVAAGAVAQRLGVQLVGQLGEVDAHPGKRRRAGRPARRRDSGPARTRRTPEAAAPAPPPGPPPPRGADPRRERPRQLLRHGGFRSPRPATSTGSAASSPATIMTSSAPIHGGTSDATTIGAPVDPPSAAASIAPARLRGAPGGHPDHGARRVIRPRSDVEDALVERGGRRPHLRTRHRRRAQQTLSVGREQTLDVVEVDGRVRERSRRGPAFGVWAAIWAATSSTIAATSSAVRASTLSRSNGSVFDVRRLNQRAVAEVDGDAVEVVERLDAAAEGLQHRVDARRGVGHGEVDLAGLLVPLVVGHHLRQRPVLLAERGEHVQRGEHAGVGTPEVAEVVVRRVFAAEDRTRSRPSAP